LRFSLKTAVEAVGISVCSVLVFPLSSSVTPVVILKPLMFLDVLDGTVPSSAVGLFGVGRVDDGLGPPPSSEVAPAVVS